MVKDQGKCRSLVFSRSAASAVAPVGLWIEALSNCGDLLATQKAPFPQLLPIGRKTYGELGGPRQMELISWSLDRQESRPDEPPRR